MPSSSGDSAKLALPTGGRAFATGSSASTGTGNVARGTAWSLRHGRAGRPRSLPSATAFVVRGLHPAGGVVEAQFRRQRDSFAVVGGEEPSRTSETRPTADRRSTATAPHAAAGGNRHGPPPRSPIGASRRRANGCGSGRPRAISPTEVIITAAPRPAWPRLPSPAWRRPGSPAGAKSRQRCRAAPDRRWRPAPRAARPRPPPLLRTWTLGPETCTLAQPATKGPATARATSC